MAKCVFFVVGDGFEINVWKDPWVPWLEEFKPKPRDDSITDNSLMVSSLIFSDGHCWNIQKLKEFFNLEFVAAI
jgi:hypothetical protein